MGKYKATVLFDITKEVQAMGWVAKGVDVEVAVKQFLHTGTWAAVFCKHTAERAFLLSEPNLKARVIIQNQKRGKRRYLIQYSFVRSYVTGSV